jgi:hypothetical protein
LYKGHYPLHGTPFLYANYKPSEKNVPVLLIYSTSFKKKYALKQIGTMLYSYRTDRNYQENKEIINIIAKKHFAIFNPLYYSKNKKFG